MRTRGDARRVRLRPTGRIRVPRRFVRYLWDEPDGTAPLEKFLLRVLELGNVAGRRVDTKDAEDIVFLYGLHRYDLARARRDFEAKFPDPSFGIYLGAAVAVEDCPGLSGRAGEVLAGPAEAAGALLP